MIFFGRIVFCNSVVRPQAKDQKRVEDAFVPPALRDSFGDNHLDFREEYCELYRKRTLEDAGMEEYKVNDAEKQRLQDMLTP